jgi:hypothetical protein
MKVSNRNFLIILLILLSACNRKKIHLARTTVSLLTDITDTNRIIPTANSLLSLYGFKENICKAVTFRSSSITDFSTGTEIEYSLENRLEEEKAGNLYDDPLFRKKQIIRFQENVAGALSELSLYSTNNRPETRCFERVCNELETLKKLDGTEKYLVVSSDMIENSDVLLGYSEGLFNSIEEDEKKSIQALIEKLEDEDKMPSKLQGISLYILFEPKTKKEDVLFKAFSNAYRMMIEKRGGQVFIKSSNILKKYNHE